MSDVKDTRWTVIGKGTKPRYVLCRCSCAAQTEREVVRADVVSGRSRSCGCAGNEKTIKRCTTHGRRHTPEFNAWSYMLTRCYNTNINQSKNYSGRGIRVCDRWRKSFEQFFADVGPKPGPTYSLDRFPNNDGDYEPGNVRWATPAEQANNKRNSRKLTLNGRTQTAAQWAVELGVCPYTLYARIRRGLTDEQVLTLPLSPRKRS